MNPFGLFSFGLLWFLFYIGFLVFLNELLAYSSLSLFILVYNVYRGITALSLLLVPASWDKPSSKGAIWSLRVPSVLAVT